MRDFIKLLPGANAKEATVGFEPTSEGFANLCLTTWPRRLKGHVLYFAVTCFQELVRKARRSATSRRADLHPARHMG